MEFLENISIEHTHLQRYMPTDFLIVFKFFFARSRFVLVNDIS